MIDQRTNWCGLADQIVPNTGQMHINQTKESQQSAYPTEYYQQARQQPQSRQRKTSFISNVHSSFENVTTLRFKMNFLNLQILGTRE